MSTVVQPSNVDTAATDIDFTQFLTELVAIRSHSGEESDVAEYLVKSMDSMGYDDADVDQVGNAVGTRQRLDAQGRIGQHIVLLGHMDTVKGEIPVRIEDGKLYGRGSVDAKGPLATFIAAAAVASIPAGTRLTVIGAVEEESSTSRGARFAARQYAPDFCIIGEPSGWEGVTIGYKGIVQIAYNLERPMGHASGLQSAVPEKAIEFWNRISNYSAEFNHDRSRYFDQLIPAIRDFNFNCDGLHDRVRLHASVRLPMGFDIRAFEQMVQGLDGDAAISTYGYEVAYRSDRNNRLTNAFNIAIRQQGQQPKFKVKTGTCDMNVVGPVWNCPIVAYGPGDSSLDHTPNEHLELEEYQRAIGVLKSVIESF